MQGSRKRRGSPPVVAAAALVLAAYLWTGVDSSSGYPGGAPSGGYQPQQQSPQQPPQQTPQQHQYQQQQQQQQQQYRSAGPGQAPPSGGMGEGRIPQGPSYDRGGMPPQGYRGGPLANPNQQQQEGYDRPPQGQGQGGGMGGSGGYPSGQAGYGGRPSYALQGMPPQQQRRVEGGDASGGFLSRLSSKLWGADGTHPEREQQVYGDRYGGGGSQYPPRGGPPQGWQPPSVPGMALQPTGPSRGRILSGYQGQDGRYGGGGQPPAPQQYPQYPQQQQQQQNVGGSGIADGGIGLWSRFKGKVFQGDVQATDEGPPSFRPKGSVLLKKRMEHEDAARMANGSGQAFGGPGAFGNPYPSFGGPPGVAPGILGGEAVPKPSGPGVPEVISVEDSVVLVLKPNELAKKKRKFKQDGASRLQVIATFDHCLTRFHAADGKSPCLKTTDVLEQSQHVMLPEAAKKVRFLRSDFKRRMEADGKAMTPEERVAALEDNLRKVYSVVSMEGGVHMNSIGPAIESQLDGIPLRVGVNDMTAALAWRAIPMTIFCAGYGNVAMEVLRRGSPRITGPGGVFTPHLRLVANFFRPDDTMTIIGMYDTVPLIHEAKKSGATLMDFLRSVGQDNVFAPRSNVLLLGAELSDLGLAVGLPGIEERISVGFLKLDEHMMEKLPRYAQAYDVVIIGDGDVSYTNEILHEIVG